MDERIRGTDDFKVWITCLFPFGPRRLAIYPPPQLLVLAWQLAAMGGTRIFVVWGQREGRAKSIGRRSRASGNRACSWYLRAYGAAKGEGGSKAEGTRGICPLPPPL